MQTIVRTLKLKTARDIAASDNHCRRLSPVDNADPAKKHLNFEFVSGSTEESNFKKGWSKEEIEKFDKAFRTPPKTTLLQRLEAHEKEREIKTPRKDSVKLVEIMFATPAGLLVDVEKQLKRQGDGTFQPEWGTPLYRYCEANNEFLRNIFGRKNIIGFQVHLDETNVHSHCWVIPEKAGKYNCKHFLGGSLKMQQLQDNYHAHMQKWMPEIAWERGQKKEITGKSHTTVKDWYKKLTRIEELGLSEKVDEFIEKTLQQAEKGPKIETHRIISGLDRQAAQVQSGVFEPKSEHIRALNEDLAELFRDKKGRLAPVSESLKTKYKPGSPRSEYIQDFEERFGKEAAEYAQQHLQRLAMLPLDGLREERKRLKDLGYKVGEKPNTGVGSH
jgi:hypothetical protein